jgi:uncharacterized protein YbbC (DUF1343 family)
MFTIDFRRDITGRLLLFLLMLFSVACKAENRVLLVGAEQPEKYMPLLKGKSVALVVNQTSMVKDVHLVDYLLDNAIDVKVIFAPEHGFRGGADAGEQIENSVDKRTGLKVVSIYGENKKPTTEQLQGVDIVVFDIQDVGCRFYTYISTLHYVIEACAENGKELLVLDRPNPNGSYIDGPVLEPEFSSFVGMDPIPIVHGCTIGELATMINREGWCKNSVKAELNVITVSGYSHKMRYSLPVKPSPNLPNDLSIQLYPSLCFFEATSVSVGRGTLFPFQVLGYPNKKYGTFSFKPVRIEGMSKYPLHKDLICYGSDLRNMENAPGFTLAFFMDWYRRFEKEDDFLTNERWFNLLAGTDRLIESIRAGKTETEIRKEWEDDLTRYTEIRKKYLLYPD